jgi:uncharacterized membrane protein YfcA
LFYNLTHCQGVAVDIDWLLAAACLGIGVIVGLTGMGGGALLTPVLVLVFGVPPLTAVSSDLVAAAVMKPVGSVVHLRAGTVNLDLVKWLCVGSVPAAFSGVFVLRALGDGADVGRHIQTALGVALLLAAAGLIARAYTSLAERARVLDGSAPPESRERPDVRVRILPTIVVGAVGGLVVGMTSVGSGSLVIVALMALYPTLRASNLVGTDLVQAVPLVGSAALAHLFFGDFHLALTASLLVGAIPGVWIGARLSTHAPGRLIRRALAFILFASALKLLSVPTETIGLLLLTAALASPVVWMAVRKAHGLPALARHEAPTRLPAAEPAQS